MAQERVRKIVVAGVMGAVSILLGVTHWGFIPWFGGVSLTIMHVPVIIAAVLQGPLVGAGVGLIFGVFSMIQAAVAPTGPADVWFTNPLLAVAPRLFIGPAAYLAWKSLERWPALGLPVAGVVGSLTNTVLVLWVIGMLGYLPLAALPPIVLVNGVPEALVSAVLVLAVVAAWRQLRVGKKQGADL